MNAQHFLLIALIVCPAFSQAQANSLESGSLADPVDQGNVESGRILYQQGRYHAALDHFRQAVREDGSSAPAHYWRGMAQYELGAYRKAVSSFKRSVELDENWASGYMGLGKAYLQVKYRRLDARNALRVAARRKQFSTLSEAVKPRPDVNIKRVFSMVPMFPHPKGLSCHA